MRSFRRQSLLQNRAFQFIIALYPGSACDCRTIASNWMTEMRIASLIIAHVKDARLCMEIETGG
jgi:hypothetical protein